MTSPRLLHRWRRVGPTLALGVAACAFDSTGLGDTSPSGPTTSASEGATTTSTGEGATSSGGSSTGGEGESASSGVTASASGATEPTTAGSTGDDTTTAATVTTGDATSTSTTSSTTADDTGTDTGGCGDPQTYYLDADMDGYGDPGQSVSACAPPAGHVADATDCDDGAATAYPGAPELCDKLDNDCDGLVDEYAPTNAGDCGACEVLVTADRVYHFCDDGSDWDGARARCGKLGGDLVVLNSDLEYADVWGRLKSRDYEHWIGASDKQDEGTIRWIDGGTLAGNDPRWAPGQPPQDLSALVNDCVAIGAGGGNSEPGRYRMLLCDPVLDRRRVCETPL